MAGWYHNINGLSPSMMANSSPVSGRQASYGQGRDYSASRCQWSWILGGVRDIDSGCLVCRHLISLCCGITLPEESCEPGSSIEDPLRRRGTVN
jgi:hypothetical protein